MKVFLTFLRFIGLIILLVSITISIFFVSYRFASENYEVPHPDPETICYIKSGKYHAYNCSKIEGKTTKFDKLKFAIKDGNSPCEKCKLVSIDNSSIIKDATRIAMFPSLCVIIAFLRFGKYGRG